MESNFEWDLGKEAINIQKHGVDFKKASEVFADPCRRIFKDVKHSEYEDRWICIAQVKEGILTVRFVYREQRIRILGAGFWRKGAELYEKKIHG